MFLSMWRSIQAIPTRDNNVNLNRLKQKCSFLSKFTKHVLYLIRFWHKMKEICTFVLLIILYIQNLKTNWLSRKKLDLFFNLSYKVTHRKFAKWKKGAKAISSKFRVNDPAEVIRPTDKRNICITRRYRGPSSLTERESSRHFTHETIFSLAKRDTSGTQHYVSDIE